MNSYIFYQSVDGHMVEMEIDLDELRSYAIAARKALADAGLEEAKHGTITNMRGTRHARFGGWVVFMSASNGFAQVRNYDKNGKEISAKKYARILEAAGVPLKPSTDTRIRIAIESRVKVSA